MYISPFSQSPFIIPIPFHSTHPFKPSNPMKCSKTEDNKENIPPSLATSKQTRNPTRSPLAFHRKKKMKLGTSVPNRKPLRDITHLFSSSLPLQDALIQFTTLSSSATAASLSYDRGAGFNPRQRKAPQGALPLIKQYPIYKCTAAKSFR